MVCSNDQLEKNLFSFKSRVGFLFFHTEAYNRSITEMCRFHAHEYNKEEWFKIHDIRKSTSLHVAHVFVYVSSFILYAWLVGTLT